MVALFGAFGSIALFSMRTLLKFGRDIQLIIWGIFVMCVSFTIFQHHFTHYYCTLQSKFEPYCAIMVDGFEIFS